MTRVAASEETQELLRQSIGPACHELRGPLAVVYGFARMLDGASDLDERSAGYVAHIVRGAERLDALLDDLSMLGRVAAGRSSPQLESLMLGPLVEEVVTGGDNATRVALDRGDDLKVKVDGEWLVHALCETIDALCFEDGIGVRVSWRHDAHEAHVHLLPDGSFPMVDVEPEKAGLGLQLARMRVVAMGGSFDGDGDRIVMRLPRH